VRHAGKQPDTRGIARHAGRYSVAKPGRHESMQARLGKARHGGRKARMGAEARIGR
jgi:hypothetical protein